VSPYQVHFVGLSAGWGRDFPTLQTILPYIIKQNAHICKMFMALSAKFARYIGKTCYDRAARLKNAYKNQNTEFCSHKLQKIP
jgi:hypothetical protein